MLVVIWDYLATKPRAGHSMHVWFSRERLNFFLRIGSSFVAEVSSISVIFQIKPLIY